MVQKVAVKRELSVVLDLTALSEVFQSISGRLPERGRKKRNDR